MLWPHPKETLMHAHDIALVRHSFIEQGAKLMQMIGAAVSLLDRPDLLRAALRKLGVRHAGYGVTEPHYATVGGALLRTLQAGLGEAFTVEVRNAWVALYEMVSRSMIDAANAEATSAATALRYA